METIPYRRSKLDVMTIPKGTLLFRILKDQENDMRGVPIENGMRCLTPNFNVFFYPNPFAAQLAFEKYLKKDYDPYVYVYVLNKDIKVLSLIKPSKYSRAEKFKKGLFMKRCSTVRKGCLPRKQNEYDVCLSDTIVEKFPEVVGTLSIVQSDSRIIKKGLKNSKNVTMRRFFNYAEDSTGAKSVPELSIHPLILRPSKDVITKEGDVLETNYSLLGKFNRNDQKSIINFMDTKTVYNPQTFYYMLKTSK
jgi:hypothetical protein